MEVVGFYPASGPITLILVKNSAGQYQSLLKTMNWRITGAWTTVATYHFQKANGLVELPVTLDFDFFLKNLNQFQR